MFETKLYAKLKTLAANVYPIVAPIKYATPAVVYNRIGTETERDISDDEQTCGYVTFQIDVYSPVLLQSKTTARTIRAGLKSWVDADIQSVSWSDEKDMVDDTTETQLYRTMTFYRFFVSAGI